MNIVDIVLAVLCLWFAVSGIARGLVRQLFSIAGLVAGHLAGIRFYAPAASMLKLSFHHNDVVGYLVVFAVVYVAFRLLGALIEGRIRGSTLSGTDRAAGLVAGLAKGALVSILVVFLLVILLPDDSRALRQSKAAPYAISAGYWLAEVFPDRIGQPFREKARAVEKFQGNVFPFRK
jgi:membrane protein required for colicin V production